MHASIEQLLDLRDTQRRDSHAGDPELRAHVDGCSACRAELSRLDNLREAMRSLPEIEPPAGRWQAIVQATSKSASSWRQPLAWGIAASLLVMVWLAGNLSGRDAIENRVVAPTGDVEPASLAVKRDDDVNALIDRSRRLGMLLQSLPGRPEVVRAGTDNTIASLENSLAWVNYTLNQPDTALTSGEARELWRSKVNLMDSLVKVRYTEASFASL
ncbi:MAG: hypothetical protein V3S53_05605 [Gammaproteobacteria bacterium]